MRQLITTCALASLGIAATAQISESKMDSLIKRIEFLEQQQAIIRQQQQVQELRTSSKDTIYIAEKNNEQAIDTNEGSQEEKPYAGDPNFSKYRIGGYGEMLYRHKDYDYNRFSGAEYGNARMNRHEISIPRFVLAGDYKFNRWFQLGAEIEFEAGGTGIAWEKESGSGSENGEIELEMEKGGEVALEQFHITSPIARWLNVQVGHMVVPVGLTNAHHEPILFFGSSRPEGETKIIPSTWHETGISIFGNFGKEYYNFDYQVMVVNGLTAEGLSKYDFVGNAKQGLFEQDLFTSPAYVSRLDYKGIKGLRIGGSFYYCNDLGKNTQYPHTFAAADNIPLTIYSIDGQYTSKWVTARANILEGRLGSAENITQRMLSRTSNKVISAYDATAGVAEKAVSYAGEVGINIGNFFHTKQPLRIYPFARYEYYNPQQKEASTQLISEERCKVNMWTFGVNWFALPNLVVKADWTTRHMGTSKPFDFDTQYNSENDLSIGVAYTGWFSNK